MYYFTQCLSFEGIQLGVKQFMEKNKDEIYTNYEE